MPANASTKSWTTPLLEAQSPPTPVHEGIAARVWRTLDNIRTSGEVYELLRIQTAIVFCIHPVTNSLLIYNLLTTSNPWWASFMTLFMVAPLLAMLVLMNLKNDSRRAFVATFEVPPTLGAIVLVNIKGAIHAISRKGHAHEQTFVKLQRVLGTGGNFLGLSFQGYIYIREFWLLDNKFKVDPMLLTLNFLMGLYTLNQSIQYFERYAEVTCGGNRWDFLWLLARLGDEMPPPSVLERLRNVRDVVIVRDLSHINTVGLSTLARCIATSPVLETVVFKGTNLGATGSRAFLEHCHAQDGFNRAFREAFIKPFTFNRGRLRKVCFEPAIDSINASVWDFSLAGGGLQLVTNGTSTVFSLDSRVPPSPLRDAVQADDEEETKAALDKYEEDAVKPACPSGHILECSSESEGLSKEIICDSCRRKVPRDYTCRSCIPCDYDLCSMCTARLQSSKQCIQHAALMNHSRALGAALNSRAEDVVGDPKVLISAALAHSGKCVELLLKSRADPNHCSGSAGPPLYAAALTTSRGCVAVLNLLLKNKADPNVETPRIQGHTALHAAAILDNVKCAKLLIEREADVNRVSQSAGPILNVCAYFNSAKVAKILLEHNAKTEVVDANGNSPLHLACLQQSRETLRLLKKYGADLTFKDSSVAQWAAAEHVREMKQALGELPGNDDGSEPLQKRNHYSLTFENCEGRLLRFLWRTSFATKPDKEDLPPPQQARCQYFTRPEGPKPGDPLKVVLRGQKIKVPTPKDVKPGDNFPVWYFVVRKNWPQSYDVKIIVDGTREVSVSRPVGAQVGQIFPFNPESGALLVADQTGAYGILPTDSFSGRLLPNLGTLRHPGNLLSFSNLGTMTSGNGTGVFNFPSLRHDPLAATV